ncbi:hypothetical protein Sjap_008261 [Stephania japonica]|uniref:Uncharacterized protein n=1 Tax=Stephania japonica TaxID=461633 RepID=A0AAP0JPA0_9MAGN
MSSWVPIPAGGTYFWKLFVRPLKDIISDNMEEDTDDESHEEDEDEYVSKCLGAISVSQLEICCQLQCIYQVSLGYQKNLVVGNTRICVVCLYCLLYKFQFLF